MYTPNNACCVNIFFLIEKQFHEKHGHIKELDYILEFSIEIYIRRTL